MTDHAPREEHLGYCCAAAAPSPRLGLRRLRSFLRTKLRGETAARWELREERKERGVFVSLTTGPHLAAARRLLRPRAWGIGPGRPNGPKNGLHSTTRWPIWRPIWVPIKGLAASALAPPSFRFEHARTRHPAERERETRCDFRRCDWGPWRRRRCSRRWPRRRRARHSRRRRWSTGPSPSSSSRYGTVSRPKPYSVSWPCYCSSCKWLLQGSRSARWSGKGDRLLAFLGILGQVLVSWPRSRGFVLTRFPPLWLQGRAFLGTSGLCAARLALICSVWCSSEFSVMMAVTGPHFLEFPVSAV
jgi:hypothetical protein